MRFISLYLRATGLTDITKDFLSNDLARSLKRLYIDNNIIAHLNLSDLSAAQHLQVLYADDCELSDRGFVIALMPRLYKL
jgi:Leucine-rich repeat (LRR) protein